MSWGGGGHRRNLRRGHVESPEDQLLLPISGASFGSVGEVETAGTRLDFAQASKRIAGVGQMGFVDLVRGIGISSPEAPQPKQIF